MEQTKRLRSVCEHNAGIQCPCPKECPRHVKCCVCVAHHRQQGVLPFCLKGLA